LKKSFLSAKPRLATNEYFLVDHPISTTAV
jgi:hypothetical protein